MPVATLHVAACFLPQLDRGGWGVVSCGEDGSVAEMSGGLRGTTCNRMEILAAVEGLAALSRPGPVIVRSASQYVCNAVCQGWLANWIARGWRTAGKGPVKNADLWRRLVPLLEGRDVEMRWVASGDESPEGRRSMVLARDAATREDLAGDEAQEDAPGAPPPPEIPAGSPSRPESRGAPLPLPVSPVAAKAGRGGEGLPEVAAFTDGACRGNPGPGGWAALVYLDDCARCLELTGGSPRTTNNRMEILAVIEALAAVPDRSRVTVYTDSRYVCDAVEKGWLRKWRATGWVRRAGAFGPAQPVKNVDLWQRLTPLLERHEVTMRWVSGHSGHPQNERCDRLARAAADASG